MKSVQTTPSNNKTEERYQNKKLYDTDDNINPLQNEDQDIKFEFHYTPKTDVVTPDNQETRRNSKKKTSDFTDQIKQDTP